MTGPDLASPLLPFFALGLLFAWMLATALIERVAVDRYGEAVGGDVARVARPAAGLLLVVAPLLALQPLAGAAALALCLALGERSTRAHRAVRAARVRAEAEAERIAREEERRRDGRDR